jgi:hypothetical protein
MCAWYVRNQALNNELYTTNIDVRIIIVLISTLITAPDRPAALQGTLLGVADEPASTSSDQHQKAFAILTLGWLPSPAPKAM